MALNDPNAPLLFDPLAPTWDDEREAAFMASLFGPPAAPVVPVVPADPSAALAAAPAPEPIAPTPPAPAPQQIGPVLSGPTQDEQLARNPEQELPAFARPIEEPPTIELPFAADAVSGVDQPPPPEAAASTSPMPTERPIEEEQDPIAQAQRWVDLSQTDPEGFQRAMMAHDLERQRELNTRTEQIAADDAAAAERGRQRVLEAQQRAEQLAAQVEADAAELAKQKVDPGRWWASRNTGQKIAGFIAAIVGGLAQSSSGGRNVGLDMINAEIDRDIEAQKTNIANGRADIMRRQGVVSELFARTGDLERSVEAARRAAKEQALQQLEIEMMKFDPNGTAARQIAQQVLTGRAEQAQANEKWRQQQFENQLKAGELAVKVDDQVLKRDKFDAEQRRRAGAGAKPPKLEDLPLSTDRLRALGINIPEGVTLPPITLGQAKTIATTAKSVEDWQKAARDNSPEERNRQFAVGDLVDVDGKPLQFRSTESASKVAKATSSADLSVQLIDRLLDARQQYGWSSDLFRSPEWREMQSDFSQLILEKKNLDELGVIAGPDMDLMQKALGTTDPTELRDPTPGLERIRKTTIEKTNALIRAEAGGQKPKRWEPPARAPKAPKSASDVEFQQLKAYDPGKDPALAGELGFDPNDPQGPAKLAAAIRVDAPLSPRIQARVDRIHARANSPKVTNEERANAREQLAELGRSAEFPALRDYAASLLVIGGGE